MKRYVNLTAVLFLAMTMHAEDLAVRITSAPKSVLAGMPFRIKGEYEVFGSKGLSFWSPLGTIWHISNADGADVCSGPTYWNAMRTRSFARLTPQKKETIEFPVNECKLVPGVYSIRMVVKARPCESCKPPVEAVEPAWHGEVTSKILRLEVRMPEGADKAAYDAFHGSPFAHLQELLNEHSGSIYAWHFKTEEAGVTIWETLARAKEDRQSLIREIGCYQLGRKIKDVKAREAFLRDPKSKFECVREGGRYVEKELDGIESFLAAHPDYENNQIVRHFQLDALIKLGRWDEARSLARNLPNADDPRVQAVIDEIRGNGEQK